MSQIEIRFKDYSITASWVWRGLWYIYLPVRRIFLPLATLAKGIPHVFIQSSGIARTPPPPRQVLTRVPRSTVQHTLWERVSETCAKSSEGGFGVACCLFGRGVSSCRPSLSPPELFARLSMVSILPLLPTGSVYTNSKVYAALRRYSQNRI